MAFAANTTWAQAPEKQGPQHDIPGEEVTNPEPSPVTKTNESPHSVWADESNKSNFPADTFEEVTQAPHPQKAGSYLIPPKGPSKALWIPRVALFPLRIATEIVNAPIRGGLWAFETWDLRARAQSAFFSADGNIGLIPVAFIETGFGLNAGLRFIYKNLFNDAINLRLRASFGGRQKQIYSLKIGSSKSLSTDYRLSLESRFDAREQDPFYGFGNTDLVSTGSNLTPRMPSPISRFAQDIFINSLVGKGRLSDTLSMKLVSSHQYRRFFSRGAFPTDQSLEAVFDADLVPGYREGVHQIYTEAELYWDTRTATSKWDLPPIFGRGMLVSGFAGIGQGIGKSDHQFLRYGGQWRGYVPISVTGPRILSASISFEGAEGLVEDIPFTERPRLGGAYTLRGYRADRFTDNLAIHTSLGYHFDLSRYIQASLFVDVGRTYSSWDALEAKNLRLGYGLELSVYNFTSFVGRLTFASTREGGFFFLFAFDQALEPQNRINRQ